MNRYVSVSSSCTGTCCSLYDESPRQGADSLPGCRCRIYLRPYESAARLRLLQHKWREWAGPVSPILALVSPGRRHCHASRRSDCQPIRPDTNDFRGRSAVLSGFGPSHTSTVWRCVAWWRPRRRHIVTGEYGVWSGHDVRFSDGRRTAVSTLGAVDSRAHPGRVPPDNLRQWCRLPTERSAAFSRFLLPHSSVTLNR